jgi:hypothetical protein
MQAAFSDRIYLFGVSKEKIHSVQLEFKEGHLNIHSTTKCIQAVK